MDERFQRLSAIFNGARRLPAAEREAYLASACGADPSLREEAAGLLDAHEELPAVGPPPAAWSAAATRVWDEVAAGIRAPDRLGGFRLIRPIASGASGTVYEAEQESPRRRIALKLLRPEAATEEGFRRFALEAEVLARLHHPGIAQVHLFGRVSTPLGETPYLVMELIEGRPLHEFAATLDLPSRVRLWATVCEAVAHAHQNGVIHRDLKPGNILVTREGQPKVLDFGLARLLESDGAGMTRSGQVLGTLAYMSPEQAAGDTGLVDVRSDVYALGVLGYEMLCGRLPHDLRDLSVPAALRRIVDEEPAPPDEVAPELRGDLSMIVRKALARDPRQRYSGAAALAEDLRRHLAHEPILARPLTATYQLRKFVRRHRMLVAGLAGVFAALILGALFSLRFAQLERRERERADRSAEQARRATAQSRIDAAAVDLVDHAATSAARSLDAVPADLRGWEWRHLRCRLDESVGFAPIEAREPCEFRFAPDLSRVLCLDGTGAGRILDGLTGATISEASSGRASAWPVGGFAGPHALLAHRSGGEVLGLLDIGGGRSFDLEAAIRGNPCGFAAAPHGRTFVVATHGGRSHSRLHLFDVATRSLVRTIVGPAVDARALAFDPEGRLLAAGGWDHAIHLYDTADGRRIRSFEGHTGVPRAVGFSPDGRLLASGGADKTVRIWETGGSGACTVLHGLSGDVNCLAFSGDSLHLATGSEDGTVRIWSTERGDCLRVLVGHAGPVRAVAFDAAASELRSAGARGIRRWPRDDPLVLRPHSGRGPKGRFDSYVYAVDGSPDGSRIASAAWDGTVRITDAATGRLLATVGAGEEHVYDVAFSPDGRTLAAGHADLFLVDADTGREIRRQAVRTLTCLAFRPDGDVLAVGTVAGAVQIRDARTLETRAVAAGHTSEVFDVAFRDDGEILASVDARGDCVVRRADDGSLLRRIAAHPGGAFAVAFARKGGLLATGGADDCVRIWDAERGTEVRCLRGHVGKVYALAFSPDGERLASGANDRTIRIWDVAAGEERLSLVGHADYVRGLCYSPDGATLYSASGDNTVRVWSTETARSRAARAEERLALERRMEPAVRSLLASIPPDEPGRAAALLRGDPALRPEERAAALQVALRLLSGEG